MPEMRFLVRWPDDSVTACYSPSLVIHEFFSVGTSYALDDFVERSRTALGIASDRVFEKYGRPCSLARAEVWRILSIAARFDGRSGCSVTVEAFDPPA